MLSNETMRKLREMRLGVMTETFSAQLEDTQFQAVSFEGRFAMPVDAEWSARKSNRLTRLILNAGYADPAACVENIEYLPERKLDREQILRLAFITRSFERLIKSLTACVIPSVTFPLIPFAESQAATGSLDVLIRD